LKIHDNVNLIKLCELFSILYPNLHRAAVINENSEFVGYITQSKIIRHFAPHIKEFNFGNSTVEILNLGHRPILKLRETDSISFAIQQLYSNKTTYAAIVDSNDKFINTFSTSDLKRFPTPVISEMLNESLKQFKSQSHHHEPLHVTKHTYCHHVVHKMDSAHVHKVFVLDDDFKPIGLITLSDIINLFWRHLLID